MQKLNESQQNGFSLIAVILCISILMIIASSIAKICILSTISARERLNRDKVFYLSESGIETAKTLINQNPSWVTDIPHTDYDKQWLLSYATGQIYYFGDGGFKIIKEQNKQSVYSIGFLGSDISKSRSYSFQRISYTVPFVQTKWEVF